MFKLVHFASDHFNKITQFGHEGEKNFVFSFYVSCDVSSSNQYRNSGINQLIRNVDNCVYVPFKIVTLMQW